MTAQTRAANATNISTNLADNTTQAITPALERATLTNINDSAFMPLTDTLSGDITTTASGTMTASLATTLATVNSNTGSFGSATTIPVITVNGKGLITAVTTATVTASITGTSGTLVRFTAANTPGSSTLTDDGAGNLGGLVSLNASGGLTINNAGNMLFQRSSGTRFSIGSTTTTWQTNMLVGSAGFAPPVADKTAAYTATSTDFTIRCNGTFTVTLPGTPQTGQILNIKNRGSGTITVSGTVDGAANPTIAAGVNLQIQYDSTATEWLAL